MDTLNKLVAQFNAIVAQSTDKLASNGLEANVGIYLNSACLKLYKPNWAYPPSTPVTAETRIFFSIWVTPESLLAQQLFYNIHAFKLRKFPGYRIESRKFAAAFRKRFEPYSRDWPNVRTDFGPLTLMEGSLQYTQANFDEIVMSLLLRFLCMSVIIDETLTCFVYKSKP